MLLSLVMYKDVTMSEHKGPRHFRVYWWAESERDADCLMPTSPEVPFDGRRLLEWVSTPLSLYTFIRPPPPTSHLTHLKLEGMNECSESAL